MNEFVEFDAIQSRRQHFSAERSVAQLGPVYSALSEFLIRVSWEGTPSMLRDNIVDALTLPDVFEQTLIRLGYEIIVANQEFTYELIKDNLPCLLLINNLSVIALEADDERVLLYDFENNLELSESYSGETITMYSATIYSKTYRESPDEDTGPGWVNQLFYKYFDDIKGLVGLTFVINLLGAVGPFFIMGVYNFAVPSESYSTLAWLTVGSIVVALVEYWFKWLRMRVLATTGQELAVYISHKVISKLLWLPYKLTSGAGASAQLTRLRDIDQFRKLVTSESTLSYFDMPFFFIFLIAIMIISGKAAITVVVGVLVIFAFGAYSRVATTHANSQSSKANSQVTYQWNEIVYGVTSIQGMPSTRVLKDRFNAALGQSIDDATVLASENQKNQGFGQSLTQTIGASSIVITVIAVINGDVDPGAMMAVIILVWKAITPLMGIFNSLSKFKQIGASSAQINALMSMQDDRLNLQKSLPLQQVDGNYTIDTLTYRYPGAPKGLTQISFKTNQSEKISIVGPPGCGKTSLLNIMFGIIDAYQGEVKISNLNIRQFNSFRLRQSVGYIPYDFTFFHGTLRDNFEHYGGKVPDHTAIEMLGKFGVIKFMDNGLETLITPELLDRLPSSAREGLRLAIGLGRLEKGAYLIDEPCIGSGTDVKRAFTSILTDLMADKMVVYSTNDKQLIAACDNCLLLDSDGGQKYYGFPDKVLSTL